MGAEQQNGQIQGAAPGSLSLCAVVNPSLPRPLSSIAVFLSFSLCVCVPLCVFLCVSLSFPCFSPRVTASSCFSVMSRWVSLCLRLCLSLCLALPWLPCRTSLLYLAGPLGSPLCMGWLSLCPMHKVRRHRSPASHHIQFRCLPVGEQTCQGLTPSLSHGLLGAQTEPAPTPRPGPPRWLGNMAQGLALR